MSTLSKHFTIKIHRDFHARDRFKFWNVRSGDFPGAVSWLYWNTIPSSFSLLPPFLSARYSLKEATAGVLNKHAYRESGTYENQSPAGWFLHKKGEKRVYTLFCLDIVTFFPI